MREISVPKESHAPATSAFMEKIQKTQEKAKEALAKAIQYMKTTYDKQRPENTQKGP